MVVTRTKPARYRTVLVKFKFGIVAPEAWRAVP